MNSKNFYTEFNEVIDFMIGQYVIENSLASPIHAFLLQKSQHLKENYTDWRIKGISEEECTTRLKSILLLTDAKDSELDELPQKHTNIVEHEWYKALTILSGQLVFYICNDEQLHLLLPLIKMSNRPIILLVESGIIIDELIDEANITIIEFYFISDFHLYNDQFIESYFPEVNKYYNTFIFLLKVLSPEEVVFTESNSFQQQILYIIAQQEGIPCLAVPQDESSIQCLPYQKTLDCLNNTACCRYFEKSREPRLHIGCGHYILEGWLNVDILDIPGVYYLDAGKPYPFQENSFNYIFSEHLFEHLTLQQGITMLRECYRVLKPGGRIRMAMPDLNFLIELYLHPEKEIHQRYLRWSTPSFVPEIKEFYEKEDYPPIYAFNNFFHAWGHQFIHSFPEFNILASKIGFKNIRQYAVGKSSTPFFQSIEKHGNGIPSWANELETMVIEMEK